MSDGWGTIIGALIAGLATVGVAALALEADRRRRTAIREALELAELLKGTKEAKALVHLAKQQAAEYTESEWLKSVRRWVRGTGYLGLIVGWLVLSSALIVLSSPRFPSREWAWVLALIGVVLVLLGAYQLSVPSSKWLRPEARMPVFTDDPAPTPVPTPSARRRRWLR